MTAWVTRILSSCNNFYYKHVSLRLHLHFDCVLMLIFTSVRFVVVLIVFVVATTTAILTKNVVFFPAFWFFAQLLKFYCKTKQCCCYCLLTFCFVLCCLVAALCCGIFFFISTISTASFVVALCSVRHCFARSLVVLLVSFVFKLN